MTAQVEAGALRGRWWLALVAVVDAAFPWFFLAISDEQNTGLAVAVGVVFLALVPIAIVFPLFATWADLWGEQGAGGHSVTAVALGALVTGLVSGLGAMSLIYWAVSEGSPASFSEALTKLDAIYFTISIFSTTGLGDISPVSQGARALVTGQIVVGFVFIGVTVGHVVGRFGARSDA